ncbi:7398_t:CDS:2, partial [Dentiscutata heterogama]
NIKEAGDCPHVGFLRKARSAFDINKDVKKLSRSNSLSFPTEKEKNNLKRRNTSVISTNNPFIDIFDFDGGDGGINENSQKSSLDDRNFPPSSPTQLHSSNSLSPSSHFFIFFHATIPSMSHFQSNSFESGSIIDFYDPIIHF